MYIEIYEVSTSKYTRDRKKVNSEFVIFPPMGLAGLRGAGCAKPPSRHGTNPRPAPRRGEDIYGLAAFAKRGYVGYAHPAGRYLWTRRVAAGTPPLPDMGYVVDDSYGLAGGRLGA